MLRMLNSNLKGDSIVKSIFYNYIESLNNPTSSFLHAPPEFAHASLSILCLVLQHAVPQGKVVLQGTA